MVYNLPTITSLNRQNVLPIRRRTTPRHEPPSSVCSHRRLRRFTGERCPMCVRQAMMEYGRIQRRRNTNRQRSTRTRLPPIDPTTFFSKLTIDLPGTKVYGRGADTCSICMNTYEKDRVCQQLPCSHRFHAWCYQKWYLKKHDCPLCRATF